MLKVSVYVTVVMMRRSWAFDRGMGINVRALIMMRMTEVMLGTGRLMMVESRGVCVSMRGSHISGWCAVMVCHVHAVRLVLQQAVLPMQKGTDTTIAESAPDFVTSYPYHAC